MLSGALPLSTVTITEDAMMISNEWRYASFFSNYLFRSQAFYWVHQRGLNTLIAYC